MPAFSVTSDLPLTIVSYVVAVVATVLWVFQSSQTVVDRNTSTVSRIVIRFGVVFGIIYLVCWSAGIVVWIPLTCTAIALLSGLSLGGSVLAYPAVAILYVIQQYVLGFPDREEWILNGPVENSPSKLPIEESTFVGHNAVTVSPLKPSGEVELQGQRLTAVSDDSQFLDTGTNVVVVSAKHGTLVVRADDAE